MLAFITVTLAQAHGNTLAHFIYALKEMIMLFINIFPFGIWRIGKDYALHQHISFLVFGGFDYVMTFLVGFWEFFL